MTGYMVFVVLLYCWMFYHFTKEIDRLEKENSELKSALNKRLCKTKNNNIV